MPITFYLDTSGSACFVIIFGVAPTSSAPHLVYVPGFDGIRYRQTASSNIGASSDKYRIGTIFQALYK